MHQRRIRRVIYCGDNYTIPLVLEDHLDRVYSGIRYNWKSYAEQGKPPSAFKRVLFRAAKEFDVTGVIIDRGCDPFISSPVQGDTFWRVDHNDLKGLMDSGVAVAVIDSVHDPNKTLHKTQLPNSCNLFKEFDDGLAVPIAEYLVKEFVPKMDYIYDKTLNCCRGKWL